MPGGGLQLRAAGQDLFQPHLVIAGQVFGVGHDPAGDPTRSGLDRRGRRRARLAVGVTESLQVTLHTTQAAGPSQLD